MNKSQIKLKIGTKWLAGRATVWGFLFRGMESTGIISKIIHSKRNDIALIIPKPHTLWLVTSVIQPNKKPFSYSKNRSIFTDELRLTQTKETIASIKMNSDHALIAIIEGSKYPKIHDLADQEVLVFQLQSKILKFVVNGPFKGLGEAILLLLFRPDASTTTYVKKISGRYVVNEDLQARPILFREHSGSAVSISYGMIPEVFNCWQNYLEAHLLVLSQGVSMEQLLHNFTRENSFTGSHLLGVSGKNAITGGEISA